MSKLNKYLNIIKTNFWDLDCNKTKFIQKWWSNDVLILDDNILFRFPKDEHTKENLVNEISLLNEIYKKDWIQTPKYIYVSKDIDFWGYKIIQWKELKKSDIKDENTKKLLAKQIWEFLTKLHSYPVERFKLFDSNVDNHYTCDEWYHKYILSSFKDIENQINSEAFNKWLKFIESTFPLKIIHKSMTHFDFQPKNIIFSEEEKEITWVIDFSDSAIYDPAIDFSFFFSFGDKFVKEVLKHYKWDFWNVFERAKFFEVKSFIFVFPELINKYPNKKAFYEKKLLKYLKKWFPKYI